MSAGELAVKTSKPEKPLNRGLWWGLFILATYLMSLWFEASRAMFADPSPRSWLMLGLMTLLLGLVMVVLMYDSYVGERRKGNVHKTIRLFEWLYRRQYGSDGGENS